MNPEIEALERRIAKLESIIDVQHGRLIVNKGMIVRGNIEMNGVQLMAGEGSPTGTTAATGSLFLRRDGGTSTTLYINEAGTWQATT